MSPGLGSSLHLVPLEEPMPTRRTLELIIIAGLALRPVFGMAKLWSIRTLATAPEGSVLHGAAEIGVTVL